MKFVYCSVEKFEISGVVSDNTPINLKHVVTYCGKIRETSFGGSSNIFVIEFDTITGEKIWRYEKAEKRDKDLIKIKIKLV